jgi:hypothetical protein
VVSASPTRANRRVSPIIPIRLEVPVFIVAIVLGNIFVGWMLQEFGVTRK